MKIKLTFKTPDVLDQLDRKIYYDDDITDEELDEKIDEARSIISKWIEYSEYLTVEFDLENQTAKVLEV